MCLFQVVNNSMSCTVCVPVGSSSITTSLRWLLATSCRISTNKLASFGSGGKPANNSVKVTIRMTLSFERPRGRPYPLLAYEQALVHMHATIHVQRDTG